MLFTPVVATLCFADNTPNFVNISGMLVVLISCLNYSDSNAASTQDNKVIPVSIAKEQHSNV